MCLKCFLLHLNSRKDTFSYNLVTVTAMYCIVKFILARNISCNCYAKCFLLGVRVNVKNIEFSRNMFAVDFMSYILEMLSFHGHTKDAQTDSIETTIVAILPSGGEREFCLLLFGKG